MFAYFLVMILSIGSITPKSYEPETPKGPNGPTEWKGK